jgi:AAA ATPase containing von Willebrand factor type A (vWA) domain
MSGECEVWRMCRAALLCGTVLVCGACLVTDALDPQPGTEPSESVNRPVRIVETGISPDNRSVVRPSNCAVALKIDGVEDPDTADEVFARWFVDGVMLSSSRLAIREGETREATSYTFEVARHALGVHSVLAAVSDGFEDGSNLRAAREGKSVVSCSWAIDTSALTQCTADPGPESDAGEDAGEIEDADASDAADGAEDGGSPETDDGGDETDASFDMDGGLDGGSGDDDAGDEEDDGA